MTGATTDTRAGLNGRNDGNDCGCCYNGCDRRDRRDRREHPTSCRCLDQHFLSNRCFRFVTVNNYVSYDGYDYGGYDVGHLSVICCVSRTVFGGHLSVVRRSSIGEQLTDSRSTVGRCVDEGRLIGSWSTVHQWLTGGGTTNRPLVNARHSVMAISRHRGSERPRTVAIVRTWSSELRSIPGSKVDPKVDPIQTR